MNNICETMTKPNRTERVIQIGEGGFLRGFVDWMLQKLNNSGIWEGSVVVVQPLKDEMCDVLSGQTCHLTNLDLT